MMPSLMIDHLSINLRSGTDNLVSEISFAIKEGESLILLGQSGSGKTMTCSAVLNLLDPKKFKVSGSVFFGETDLLNSSEKQRRGIYGNQIVYIPQNPMTALDPSMRIGRQMDETLRLHSDKSRQQRYNYILRLLHDVGLDDPDRVYRAYPHMLSGGMLQRVIIAMAMMLDAKFVLADEPTTALDVIHRNGIIDLFSQMKANGVGILMVTHDFATALQLGGNVLVMKEGKIIEQKNVTEKSLNTENINSVFKTLIGKQEQIPPIYSALKVNGKKLYEYARNGENVKIEPRQIEIYSLELLNVDNINKTIHFKVECSKGTYIRTLCEGIAERLGTVGYMKELNRTRVGDFYIENSITIEQLEQSQYQIITIEQFFKDEEFINLTEKGLKLFLNGVQLTYHLVDGIYRIYQDDKFIGIGTIKNELLKRDIII